MSRYNSIKQLKVKQGLLAGKSAIQAVKDAGYTDATASHSTGLGVVKCSIDEIRQDIIDNGVTAEYVIDKLKREADNASNASDRISALSWLGKYLAMFVDKRINTNHNADDTDVLKRYGIDMHRG